MTIHVHHPKPDYTGPATINGRTLHFVDGHAKAEGVNLAAFRRAGYTLVNEGIIDLEKLTVEELRGYATTHDIDISGAKRKADIINILAAAPPEPITDPNAEQDTPEETS